MESHVSGAAIDPNRSSGASNVHIVHAISGKDRTRNKHAVVGKAVLLRQVYQANRPFRDDHPAGLIMDLSAANDQRRLFATQRSFGQTLQRIRSPHIIVKLESDELPLAKAMPSLTRNAGSPLFRS